MKKRLLALTLSFALVASLLAACGGGASSTAGTAGEGDTAPAAADNTTAGEGGEETPEAGGDAVVLEILSLKNEAGAQAAFEELCNNFTAMHPNVTFDIQAMTSDNLKTTLRARAASGDMPDLITWMKEVETEYMMDLSGQSFLNNLNSDSVAAANAIYNSETYAMPIDNGYIGLYYNKDVLAQHDIELPTTLSDLQAACDALVAAGEVPFATGCNDLSVPYVGLIAIFAETVYGRNPNWSAERDAGAQSFATDADWELAFDLMKEYIYGYADSANTFNMGYDDANTSLALGNAAFLVQGSWALSGIREANESANIGLAAFPISEDESEAKLLCFPDTAMSICAGTNNEAEALAFLEYLSTAEAGTIWSENVRVSSTVNGVDVDYDPIAGDISYYVNNDLFTPYGDRVLRSVFTDKLWEDFSKFMLDEVDWATMAATLDEFWDKAVEAEEG